MKKLAALLVLMILSAVVSASAAKEEKSLVILDTAMSDEADMRALLLLEESEKIDLLGVTIVAGAESMSSSCARCANELSAIGSDTAIYQGSRIHFRYFRTEPMYVDSRRGDILSQWSDDYQALYGKEPQYGYVYGPDNPDGEGNKDATDFLVEMADRYPGRITILATGPLTNIARAILKDPSFPSKIEKIVYAGGAFYVSGDTTSVAEFDWFLDPEAAKVCIRSKWGDQESDSYASYGNQIIAPLDAQFQRGEEEEELGSLFAAAYLIDPSIVLSWNDAPVADDGLPIPPAGVYVDVNAEMTPDYGRAIVYSADRGHAKDGPAGARKAAIMKYIDDDRFWNEVLKSEGI